METPILRESVSWRDVAVPVAGHVLAGVGAPSSFPFPGSRPYGSGAAIAPAAANFGRMLFWRILPDAATVLELFEVALEAELQQNAVRLTFPSNLFPSVAFHQSKAGSAIYAVTEEGLAYCIDLPSPPLKPSCQSVLAQVTSRSITQRSLTPELVRLEGPAGVDVVGQTLLLGTRSGSVLGVNFKGNQQDGPFELKEGEAIMRRLWSVLNRPVAASPIAALGSAELEGCSALLALHADNTLRVWDVHRRSRLSTQSLPGPPGWQEGLEPSWLRVQEGDSADGEAVYFAVHYSDLANTSAKGLVAVFSIEQDNTEVTVEYHHTLPSFQESVVDVRLAGEKLCMLLDSGSATRVLQAANYAGDSMEECTTAEQQLEEALLLEEHSAAQDRLFLDHLARHDSLAPVISVGELLEGRLLAPENLSRRALLALLRAKGQQWSAADLAALPLDRIRTELRALAASQGLGGGQLGELDRWQNVSRGYAAAWHTAHGPLGLVAQSNSGATAMLRQGSLALVRKRHATETRLAGESTPPPADWSGSSEEWATAGGVVALSRSVRTQLGPLATAAFADLLLASSDPAEHLLPFYSHLLQAPLLSSTDSDSAQEFHQQQRKFSVSLVASCRNLQSEAGGWSRVAGAVSLYLAWLQGQPGESLPRGGGASGGDAISRGAEGAAGQLARAQLAEARDVLILLTLLDQHRSQVGLKASDAAVMTGGALLEAQEAATWALLVQWLAATWAQGSSSQMTPHQAPDDFSARLSSMHLSSGGGVSSEETTLLQLILRELPVSASAGDEAQVQVLQKALASMAVLRWGAVTEGPPPPISERAVELAMLLCTAGQYALLQPFLLQVESFAGSSVVGRSSSSGVATGGAAIAFLLGLCSLARACSAGTDTSAGAAHAEDAQQAFFRAAAGVDRGDPLLHQALQSFDRPPPLPGQSGEVRRLAYYDLVMSLFERYQLTSAALAFARAALREVSTLAKSLKDGSEVVVTMEELEVTGGPPSEAVEACLARFWSIVFELCLDERQYPEAYSALTANTSPENRSACLRRFVSVLCDNKAVEVLCGLKLSYADMLPEVEYELLRKAENSEVQTQPSLYALLYSFHAGRQNWRRAAWVMLRLAERLHEESPAPLCAPILKARAHALLAAAQALRLLHPQNRWIDNLRPSLAPEVPSPNKRPRTAVPPEIGDVVDLQRVEEEHALVRAALVLLEHGHPLPRYPWAADAMVEGLVAVAEYDAAFSLAKLCFQGLPLQDVLERLFARLAEQCCRSQLEEDHAQHTGGVPLLESGAGRESDPLLRRAVSPTALWNCLKAYLAQYDGVNSGFRFQRTVAQTILGSSARMQLPLWLLDRFKGPVGRGMAGQGADAPALLRILMDHGRVRKAAEFALAHITAMSAQRQEGSVARWKKACSVWLPYTLLQRLQNLLKERAATDASNAAQWQGLQQALTSALGQYLEQAERDSQDLAR